MSPLVWVALAGGVVALGPPARVPKRLAALGDGGRVRAGAGSPSGGGAARIRSASGRTVLRSHRSLGIGAAAAVVVGVATQAGPALGLAAAALLAALLRVAADLLAARSATTRAGELTTAVHVLVAETEAGSRPGEALVAAGDAAPLFGREFGSAAAAISAGGDAADVLLATQDLRAVGLAWQLSEQTGAPLVAVLDRVAADLAADGDRSRAVDVALAGPRASAALLSLLPLVGVSLGVAMGARPLPFLAATGAGRIVCCAGVLLDVGGVFWMRGILHRAREP